MQDMLRSMVEEYGDRVFRLALRYTGDRTQAEDLTQDTFLKAFKNLGKFDRSKNAGPWLFKIATNLCHNWVRDNRETPVERIEVTDQDDHNNPEMIVLAREKEHELSTALQQLPKIYREVILLKHVGELSYTEICEALDLELSLVKNRLYRGRIILKDLLMEGT